MTDSDDRPLIEDEHPIARNPARKGLIVGIVIVALAAVVGYFLWSTTPLADIGIAYSAVGVVPYLIAIGACLLIVRAVLLRRRRRGESDRATSATTTRRDREA